MAKIDFTRERTYGKSFDGILKLQGHVSSEENLPSSAEKGDVYSVGEDKILYVFDGDSFTSMCKKEIPAATEETIGGIRLGYSTLENAVQNKITPFEVRKMPTLGEDYARIGFGTLMAEDIPGSGTLHYTKQQLASFFWG